MQVQAFKPEVNITHMEFPCAPITLVLTNTFLLSIVCLRPEFYKTKKAIITILWAADALAVILGSHFINGDDGDEDDKCKRAARLKCLNEKRSMELMAILLNAYLVFYCLQKRDKFIVPVQVPFILSHALCVVFNGVAWSVPILIFSSFGPLSCWVSLGDIVLGQVWGFDMIICLSLYRSVFICLSFINDYINEKNDQEMKAEGGYVAYI
ncbi:predicted protein [Nematostella vectensis]|uniref:Uncharacterized protein n=1 Tax=Nematostella vectensis TaxID=45351 RepID=A7RHJ7_NEMVE|nr:predicted protein [Nematostella vectensis]|eukprot:XP_001640927.1 predicted protein [Nematostella vectensis]